MTKESDVMTEEEEFNLFEEFRSVKEQREKAWDKYYTIQNPNTIQEFRAMKRAYKEWAGLNLREQELYQRLKA